MIASFKFRMGIIKAGFIYDKCTKYRVEDYIAQLKSLKVCKMGEILFTITNVELIDNQIIVSCYSKSNKQSK